MDTRLVLRWYAAYAAGAGMALIAAALWFGPLWSPDQAWPTIRSLRITGALMLMGGTGAWMLSGVDDARERLRGLGWFLAGHSASMLAGASAAGPGVPPGLADGLTMAWATPAALLTYIWANADGQPTLFGGGLISLFGDFRRASAPARSRYEEAIRRAAAQEERHRLARDLHDSVKQQLFAINTSAATAQARLGDDARGAAGAIDAVRASARDALAEMDAMLDQLREAPVELNGLVASLRKQCEALRLRTGADVSLDLSNLPSSQAVAPGVLPEVLRVAQEALANVARHARARHVGVSLAGREGGLSLVVEDNGRGFDQLSPAGGMGLSNMRMRAEAIGGTLECRSTRGGGTMVRLHVPTGRPAAGPADARAVLVQAIGWGLLTVFWLSHAPSFLKAPMVAVTSFAFLRTMRSWTRLRATRQVVAR